MTNYLSSVLAALVGHQLIAVRVQGTSMEPSFHNGDQVLIRRDLHPVCGMVVVVERPDPDLRWPEVPVALAASRPIISKREWIIKRVAAIAGDAVPRSGFPALADAPEDCVPPGKIVLFGDNDKVSYDSRRMGYFPADRVLGAVWYSRKRKERTPSRTTNRPPLNQPLRGHDP